MSLLPHNSPDLPVLSGWVDDPVTGGKARWWGPVPGPRERLAATVREAPKPALPEEPFIVSVWPPQAWHGALLLRVPCSSLANGQKRADEALVLAGLLRGGVR